MTRLLILTVCIIFGVMTAFVIGPTISETFYTSLDIALDSLILLDGWLPVVTIFDCLTTILGTSFFLITLSFFRYILGD